MLTEVKNLIKITFLSTKYAIMREMENKVAFIMNVLFMILNNASFILVWVVMYSIKDNINGYTINTILLLWGIASGTYGVSRAFFRGAYELSNKITDGKLDAFLVMPKNVLIQSILGVTPSAFGDLLYAYILLFISGITPYKFIVFTLLLILGGIVDVCSSIIYNSLAFWLGRVDSLADSLTGFVTMFGTYPDTIFNRFVHILFYTFIPVAFIVFVPLRILINFNITDLLILLGGSSIIIILACIIFYAGLRRYSSSNLMVARI